MRWLIVDDEPLARQRLARLLSEAGETVVAEAGHLVEARLVYTTANGDATLGIDAIALDIEMPCEDDRSLGPSAVIASSVAVFNWVRELRNVAPAANVETVGPAIILVSAHADFGPEAFDIAVDDYLSKPVEAERIASMLARLRRRSGSRSDLSVLLRTGRTTRRVSLTMIGAFEAANGATVAHWHDGSVAREGVLDATLAELENQLGQHVLRAHRGWLVRRDAMQALESHQGEASLTLAGLSIKVPVSRRQVAGIREALARAALGA
ncbi:MAG: LytR/AlgR family response regulator transcription factor [Thioalkalivibrionaceae bacterium]